jgi:hypothetical protein
MPGLSRDPEFFFFFFLVCFNVLGQALLVCMDFGMCRNFIFIMEVVHAYMQDHLKEML